MAMQKVFFIGDTYGVQSLPETVYPDTFDGRCDLADDLLMDVNIESITGSRDFDTNRQMESQIEDLIIRGQIALANDLLAYDYFRICEINLSSAVDTAD